MEQTGFYASKGKKKETLNRRGQKTARWLNAKRQEHAWMEML